MIRSTHLDTADESQRAGPSPHSTSAAGGGGPVRLRSSQSINRVQAERSDWVGGAAAMTNTVWSKVIVFVSRENLIGNFSSRLQGKA